MLVLLVVLLLPSASLSLRPSNVIVFSQMLVLHLYIPSSKCWNRWGRRDALLDGSEFKRKGGLAGSLFENFS
jgi:hypothetical protein